MWAGMRPKTPDSCPLLDPIPPLEKVTIASGHGEIGILESIITSETVAELVTADQTLEVIPPFVPKGNSGNDEQGSTQSNGEADNKTQLLICNIDTSII
jgi:hypothetical protein